MITWHVGEKGMTIYDGREPVAFIDRDYYPKIIENMAREVSKRWDDAGRKYEE